MKHKLIIGLLLLCSSFVTAQEIKWVSLGEALDLQKKHPKKIMMDVYTNWCGPCKMLDKNTFHNKDVVNYVNEHYYAVKFNAEGNEEITFNDKVYNNPDYNPANANRRNGVHNFTRSLGVSAYPTIVFFDEAGQFIAPIRGYQQPRQLELYLKLFYSDDYKTMKTQDSFNTYYEAFVPEFSE
ncbi:thioredoxin family protein [Formosa sp. S-31]|uniref:thioredoxin family protein n=1 Tax=Formosa sp. S-31 TaxID=2790949 RepID=UPI003EC148C4